MTGISSACRVQKGFTLVELMIVVAVIGILAAIAYPSYRDFVRRGNRSDAKAVLLRAAKRLERRFTETNSYAGATIGAGALTDVRDTEVSCSTAKDVWGSTTSPEEFYTISLPTLTASTFTLQAVATGTQVDDTTCATMQLAHTGAKTPAACW